MFESPAVRHILERLANETLHDPFDVEVRLIVQMRARDACEYCLMPTRTRFDIDHIVPLSWWTEYLRGALLVQPVGGDREPNHLENFAWSCSHCNGFKGNRVSGRVGRHSLPLFHPRRDRWDEHFLL